jgi:septal ring factor EnvC (AmiA/AmiB activator)
MQKKVEEEGAKNKELYDKFMCYCKTAGASLTADMTAAETKIPAVGSSIKEAEASKVQAEADLKKAQVDRSAAKEAMASATALRDKESKAYAEEKATYETNIAALKKAVTAVEHGMFGSFLQTTAAQAVRKIALDSQDLEQQDRRDVLAFFSAKGSSDDDAPSTGEIVGILKQMGDTMAASLKEATGVEDGSNKTYDELIAAKTKEVDVLTEMIQAKTIQIGELGISIVQMKNDLSETEAALLENKQFLADMKKSCSTKTEEYNAAASERAAELAAISETIKVLNDDDSMELFKKTLPGAGSNLLQIEVSQSQLRVRALAALRSGADRFQGVGRSHLDLISLALRGKTIGFEKVIAMIDEMVGTLKKEQLDDDHKKEYCAGQFDYAEDKKKSLERKISTEETAIANAEEGIATLKEEIASLEDGIKALDKEVAKAAEQRKEEHAAYSEMMASDTAAKELLLFAKNRLNKFYNPKLYAPPEKIELSAEDRIFVSGGGTLAPTQPPGGIAGTGISFAQLHATRNDDDAAPPAPAAYAKKSEESTGVIAMIDLLVKDLDAELTTAETSEKDSQSDYATFMKDSAEKRSQDASTLTEKELTKADLEAALEGHKESKADAGKELMGTEGYIATLHAECDWLIKYFDVRKGARDEEIGNLANAKAVLSGADYSA